ncbi:MAG TPA: thioredoxin domain-containing protein, partial [Puia sp.]
MSNRLAKESSPYLLQHANNPVDWFPWGDEAIRKSRDEDKPMLVSIGYSACHWCHVMERESFEDPETAEIMNLLFVNIKIDREERPDLDQIYMDAVQAIAGSGGWPLNVFLTPDGKPFYGGTYFPPVNLHNRPSWKSVLQSISTAFREKRSEIEEQANNLTNHIAGTGFGSQVSVKERSFMKEDVQAIQEQLMKSADRENGGFGAAPKFPQTYSIRFLLQHYYYTGDQSSIDQACLSLDKMIYGGIYDQLAGGFARYSTDGEWLAPHFEKMLYDNALLIIVMCEAYQLTQQTHYPKAIRETMLFIKNELYSGQGGFYSALDADSEGEEGKYYVWDKNEILEVLGSDGELFCSIYDVSERGNWEGKNILRIKNPEIGFFNKKDPKLSAKNRNQVLSEDDTKLAEWKKKLKERRNRRMRPRLDDKILLGWNALMITACCKAFAALGDEEYRRLALRNIAFLEEKMKGDGANFFIHSYKNTAKNEAKAAIETDHPDTGEDRQHIPAFLDDYAFLIEAYIQLQEVTGEAEFLNRARILTMWVIENFSEEDSGYFYFTHAAQNDVIVRKRDIYDGATPSGNAVMALNLLYLGTVFDLNEWKQRAGGNV